MKTPLFHAVNGGEFHDYEPVRNFRDARSVAWNETKKLWKIAELLSATLATTQLPPCLSAISETSSSPPSPSLSPPTPNPKMGSTVETQMTPTEVFDEEANLFAMQLASASILPMVLKAALELDILEIMAKAGPGALVSLVDLASQLPTKNPDVPVMLDRVLRLLANYSILTYSLRTLRDGNVERLYDLGPVCKFLTKNEDDVSIAPLNPE